MKFSASCKFFFLLFFLLLIRSWSGYSLPHTHGLKIYVNKTCDMMEKIRVLHAMTVVLYWLPVCPQPLVSLLFAVY